MSKNIGGKLSDLVEAVRKLPDDTQEALIEEFAERVSDFSGTSLTGEHRDEVKRRLANPRYADPESVRSLFARHGATSRWAGCVAPCWSTQS